MRCGQLCRSCAGSCADTIDENNAPEIECPLCSGRGCDQCDGGGFSLTECPRTFIGYDLAGAINVASYASKGVMPVAGGLLDQAAWFFDLWTTLESETNKIDSERLERYRRHG